MQLSSWLLQLPKRLRRVRPQQLTATQRHRVGRLGELERLEVRELLTVSATIIQNELIINATGGEAVTVRSSTATPPRVEVLSNGVRLNTLTATLPTNLAVLNITGGDGNNAINLSAVTAATFGAGLRILVNGGNGNDTITGSPDVPNSLLGGDGLDTITGGSRNDTLVGGDGNDSVIGGLGDDSLSGGNGTDRIDGGVGNDSIDGGDGPDVLLGNIGNDTILGAAGNDSLQGGAGNDVLNGGSGLDTLMGEADNDSLLGGLDNDSLLGGLGLDTLSGDAGNDILQGEADNDSLDGGDGNDSLLGGDGNDNANGALGNDTVIGEIGNDTLFGGGGNDGLFGDSSDPLVIGLGNDSLKGNSGNDTLNGGGGRDTINGDAGDDLIRSGDFDTSVTPIVTIANAPNVTEGSTGQTTLARFVVTLSRPATQIVTVQYTTFDGSATAASNDFTGSANMLLSFPIGITTLNIDVPVIGDGQLENDENFFVRLTNATNAAIGDFEGTAFIVNDDGWSAQGPAPILAGNTQFDGCIQAVAADPTNPNILFVGSVNGGIWKTTNATAASPTWIPQTDFLPSLSIGALEFDPTDASRLTLMAGIASTSSFNFTGGPLTGALRTTDGGNTWAQLTSPALLGRRITSVAARGSLLMAAADFGGGLFRSTDTGATFQAVSGVPGTGLPAGNVSDLVGDPRLLNRFYAAVVGVGLFRSDDVGATWINVTSNINVISAANVKIEMAVFNDGTTNVLYCQVMDGLPAPTNNLVGVFRSTDLGASWTALDIPNTGGQGSLHSAISADSTNPNLVYVSGVAGPFRLDVRLAAGSQATQISAPHTDSREMVFDAAGNLIETGDGGIFRLTSPQTSGNWAAISGTLQITEAHDLAYDSVSNIIIVGTQDNGTAQQVATGSLAYSLTFGGDGADLAIDTIQLAAQNRSIRYSSSQNLGMSPQSPVGNFHADVYDAGNNLISRTFLPLTVSGNGAAINPQFRTPISTNAVAGNRLIIGGSNSTYESIDGGLTVTEIGPGVGVNGFDPTAIAYGGRLNGVANPSVLYVGSGNRVFTRTAAGGPFAATTAAYPGGFVNDIVLDPANWQNAWVTGRNGVFATMDAGATWISLTGNLTATQTRTIEYVGGATPAIVVGAQEGVFRMLLSAPNVWSELGSSSLPNVAVWELAYNPANDLLVAGTMGRGAWTFAAASFGQQFNNPIAGNGGLVNLSASGDVLSGDDGNDTVIGNDGDDSIDGGLGDDSLVGGGGQDTLLTGGGNDITDGGDDDDELHGEQGNGTLNGGAGSNTLILEPFANGMNTSTTLSTTGADKVEIRGTAGNDTFTVSQVGGLLRITTQRASIVLSDSVRNVTLIGGDGNDTVTLNAIDQVLPVGLVFDLGAGNDRFIGQNSKSGRVPLQVLAGDGNDTLTGSSGVDYFEGGAGNDSITGGDGNDELSGGIGDDVLRGGIGNDELEGGDGSDVLDGEVGNDLVSGGDGHDSLTGAAGNDTLKGDNGNDSLFAGTGDDRLEGGTGDDSLKGNTGNDFLSGGDGNDTLKGDEGNDTISAGDGHDRVEGGDGNDLLAGGDGNDLMLGGLGNDTLLGDDGNDTLSGDEGNDTVLGGDGDDIVRGNAGTDKLAGGDGTNDLRTNLTREIDELFRLDPAVLSLLV